MKNGLYINECGTKCWYLNGLLHRDDGPAEESADGSNKIWFHHGQIHREDGPAEEYPTVNLWVQHGKLHRIGGPAAEYSDGGRQWWIGGKCHREDGPAVIISGGHQVWYWQDKKIDCSTQEEFERLVRLKAFW